MTKHTPGPWRVDAEDLLEIKCDEGWSIAMVLGNWEHYDAGSEAEAWQREQDEANARLIARAPKLDEDNQQLLEACREALEFHDNYDPWGPDTYSEESNTVMKKLQAAIAAAEADDE